MAALFIFLVSILFCAFFAGYETGFVSANLFRIRHLAEKEQNTRAIRLAQRYEHPNR